MAQQSPRILIYLLRRDLRLTDNPVFQELSNIWLSSSKPPTSFTHVLPLYVFPAHQIEISGFLSSPESSCPYPPARSQVGGFWRCGPIRVKYLAQSVWDFKESLNGIGSGLSIRVGAVGDVVRDALDWFDGTEDKSRGTITAVWMTEDEPIEEKQEERDVKAVVEARKKEFRLIRDEKYFVDDRDLPFDNIGDLPDIYTSYRKSVEPLRERPRSPLPKPDKGSLPPFPPSASIPPQSKPFRIPDTRESLFENLLKPLSPSLDLSGPPKWPSDAVSAHPFEGGETAGQERVRQTITRGAMTNYKDTRNGMLGADFSTKLSAYLALGCISARWVHAELLAFEDGNQDSWTSQEQEARKGYEDAKGYGKGENDGTAAVRFELLWRDYMRLCARKFGARLFLVDGFRGHESASEQSSDSAKRWLYIDRASGDHGDDPVKTREVLTRFLCGRTGTGLIDASQRELFLTGYTSNRARQNVASFLAKHLGIDWRLGAEWYECCLVDYDVCSNWGNWQYVAGVGNDPRLGRQFNPVKQGLDYDPHGEYVKMWVEELRGVHVSSGGDEGQQQKADQEKLMGVFQAWRLPEQEKQRLGLKGEEWVEQPLVRIHFDVSRKPRDGAGARGRGRGRGRPGEGYRGRGGRGRGGHR